MFSSLYQEYLYVVGKLKDIYPLNIDVNHKDIHTFYDEKRPIFKLLYGTFNEETEPSIVVSFHINIRHVEAIIWYSRIYNIHPLLRLHDSHIEDDRGETYLGADAETIRDIKLQQDILSEWLNKHAKEDIEEFVDAKVHGRQRDSKKSFSSQAEAEKAIIEFEKMQNPDDDGDVH